MTITASSNISVGPKIGNISFYQSLLNGQPVPNSIIQPIVLDILSVDFLKQTIMEIKNFELTYLTPFLVTFPLAFLIYMRINNLKDKKKINVLSVDGTVITGVLIL